MCFNIIKYIVEMKELGFTSYHELYVDIIHKTLTLTYTPIINNMLIDLEPELPILHIIHREF